MVVRGLVFLLHSKMFPGLNLSGVFMWNTFCVWFCFVASFYTFLHLQILKKYLYFQVFVSSTHSERMDSVLIWSYDFGELSCWNANFLFYHILSKVYTKYKNVVMPHSQLQRFTKLLEVKEVYSIIHPPLYVTEVIRWFSIISFFFSHKLLCSWKVKSESKKRKCPGFS